MDLNQTTLVAFEKERSEYSFIPPYGSNSFYTIGSGIIDLYCANSSLIDYLFELAIKTGTVYVGNGDFTIGIEDHYHSIEVREKTSLINNGNLYIKDSVDVYGKLTLQNGSNLIMNGGTLFLHPGSELCIEEGADINIIDGFIKIYGEINVDVSLVDSILSTDGIYVDSSAILIVDNIDLGDREYSMTDYELDLRDKIINTYTQGEYNFKNGKGGYIWKAGNIQKKSQILELDTIYGEIVLGDFKLSVLGTQKELIPALQVTKSFCIKEGSTLYIAEEYNGQQFLHPELYLGIIIDNCDTPADCIVDGTIIVSGESAKITIDRKASLTINDTGIIYLQNGSIIKSTNNDDETVLYINGTLIMDDISQIKTFESSNIEFGENGKVVILNPDTGVHKVLFSTPDGIKNSELYRIFEDKIDHVEYHIQNNTGIKIDKYYQFYSKDMTDWYGGRRIEKAIKDGLIVWHNGGFIELDHSIIPWAYTTCSLLQASRLFKTTRSYDNEKLQEVIDHLRYAGCGNIIFRYIEDDSYVDVTLVMDDINMKSITNAVSSNDYILNTDVVGELFMKNNISDTSSDNLISKDSKIVSLNSGDTQFSI